MKTKDFYPDTRLNINNSDLYKSSARRRYSVSLNLIERVNQCLNIETIY